MRQVRFAVVLNGGVSLAVWMGGVTHELNRIRLSSEALTAEVPTTPVSEAWAAILTRCGRSAVVDILAGSSAGGLNGTLLATAVARGADLPDMRTEWSNVASLDVCKLTRLHPEHATSVLDGGYFKRRVDDIVGEIVARGDIPPRECTLLVTATALRSPPRHSYLDNREQLNTRDGRRVYKFERSWSAPNAAPSIDDFELNGPVMPTLVRAARASASFPAAFAPVWETPQLIAKRTGNVPDGGGSWLVDGGVLDNAPFEPLLDVLRERATDEPFERVVLYITPGVTERKRRAQHVEPPRLPITKVLSGVMAAMREPDERLDSDALDKIFNDMSYSKSQASSVLREYMTASSAFNATTFTAAAAAVFEMYCVNRTEAIERWLISVSGAPVPLQPPKETILTPGELPAMPSSFPDVSPEADGGWHWGLATADRILRWWGRALASLSDAGVSLEETSTSAALKVAMGGVATSQRKVTACWKLFEDAVSGTPTNTRALSEQVSAMHAAYDQTPISLTTVLGTAMADAASAVVAFKPELDRATLLAVSVSVEVLSGLFSWAGDDYDVPVFRYQRVTPAVEAPPGIALEDATKADWAEKKLYGERLGHFGAFMDPQGRQHDWMWGRLDGASELSKRLLEAARVPKREARSLREDLIAEILADEGTTAETAAADAHVAYEMTSTKMLDNMSASDDGAAFVHLDATVWEIARQLKTTGGVIRSVLAPNWTSKEIADLKGRGWHIGLPIARRVAGWLHLRPALPRGIALLQKSKEPTPQRHSDDPPTPTEA